MFQTLECCLMSDIFEKNFIDEPLSPKAKIN